MPAKRNFFTNNPRRRVQPGFSADDAQRVCAVLNMKNYFSCGQSHTHKMPLNSNVIWDKDGLIEIEAETPERAERWVNAIFGPPLPRDRRPPMEADPDPRERGESAGNGISRRGLFLTPVAAPAPQPVPLPTVSTPPPPPRIPLGQRVAHLRLVGIINGPKRQAVLDDARQGTTRYVSAGDTIGDVRVERVEKDRVVFTFENEAVDLSL